jgi:hypothetical protein
LVLLPIKPPSARTTTERREEAATYTAAGRGAGRNSGLAGSQTIVPSIQRQEAQ